MTALLLAVTARVLWWTVEPLVPYLVVGLVLVTIAGLLYYRKSRW
ncbi:cytochrome b6-f complex subunit PetG [Amycolatopsis sp. H20-H5]|nr:cytochrome b6-f complex subunit PetG [Amycolatopsis sp. H20-H5]MEC3978146.1 cytochrome b6-f complex subunit PetG [Amycolatopsis sp. H20-H5]